MHVVRHNPLALLLLLGALACDGLGAAPDSDAGDHDAGGSGDSGSGGPGTDSGSAGVDGGGRVDSGQESPYCAGPLPVRALDLLLVIDSDSELEDQVIRDQALSRLIDALALGDRDRDGLQDFAPFRSLHVGLLTGDMGVGAVPGLPSCEMPSGADGVLQACLSGQAPEDSDAAFVVHGSGDLVPPRATACLSQSGCGVAQPLEAMLKALWPSIDRDLVSGEVRSPNRYTFLGDGRGSNILGHGDRENAGFLRLAPAGPGEGRSLLAILVLTDREECSALDTRHFTPPAYLEPGDPLLAQPLGLRCHYNQHNLYGLERYVGGLRGLRPGAEHLLIFGAIGGLPAGQEHATPGELADPSVREAYYRSILDDPAMEEVPEEQGLRPVCETQRGTTAAPARRLVELARDLGDNSVVGSICALDLVDPIDRFLATIEHALVDAVDPGWPGACED